MGFLTLLDPASSPRMEALMLEHLLPGVKVGWGAQSGIRLERDVKHLDALLQNSGMPPRECSGKKFASVFHLQ